MRVFSSPSVTPAPVNQQLIILTSSPVSEETKVVAYPSPISPTPLETATSFPSGRLTGPFDISIITNTASQSAASLVPKSTSIVEPPSSSCIPSTSIVDSISPDILLALPSESPLPTVEITFTEKLFVTSTTSSKPASFLPELTSSMLAAVSFDVPSTALSSYATAVAHIAYERVSSTATSLRDETPKLPGATAPVSCTSPVKASPESTEIASHTWGHTVPPSTTDGKGVFAPSNSNKDSNAVTGIIATGAFASAAGALFLICSYIAYKRHTNKRNLAGSETVLDQYAPQLRMEKRPSYERKNAIGDAVSFRRGTGIDLEKSIQNPLVKHTIAKQTYGFETKCHATLESCVLSSPSESSRLPFELWK